MKNLDLDFIYDKFNRIPVAINNMYGDPTLQWNDTINKLKYLKEYNHKGIIAIITRGYLDEKKIKDLEENKTDGLIVIVSYSGLGQPYEHIEPTATLKSIYNLSKSNIDFIVNIRPIFPKENGTKEQIDKIFKDLHENGAKNVIVSGYRGNEEMICSLSVEEKLAWSLRYKLISIPMAQSIKEASEKYNIVVSKRVSCGVVVVKHLDYSWNPYFNSPQLVGCKECSNYNKCEYQRLHTKIDQRLIDFLDYCGYDITIEESEPELCSTLPAYRPNCPSCCTACFITHNKKIWINNDDITLADTAFIRFISDGIVATKTGVIDCGNDTGVAKVLSRKIGKEVYFVNSWMVWANQMTKCYGCSYCITQAYSLSVCEVGMSPYHLFNALFEKQYDYIESALC